MALRYQDAVPFVESGGRAHYRHPLEWLRLFSLQNHRSERRGNAEVRCAIYTRKSTEEGLSQEFNSLDAQREAAESYIQSQRGLAGN